MAGFAGAIYDSSPIEGGVVTSHGLRDATPDLLVGSVQTELVDYAFVITSIDPALRGNYIESGDTKLVLDIYNINSVEAGGDAILFPPNVEFRINGVLIYGIGADPQQPGVKAWHPTYSSSQVTDQGAGVFRYSINRSSSWVAGTRYWLTLTLPFEV